MTYEEGTLSGGSITNKRMAQAWTLEHLGNWKEFKYDTNGDGSFLGAGDLDQDRLHNSVNEIDNDNNHANSPSGTITAAGGQANWVDPVHDAAGNMMTIPQPAALTSSYTVKYDPWNRLIQVKESTNTIAQMEYDGLGRRIQRVVDNNTYDYYFNEQWQLLETRKNGDSDPLEQFIWHPYYIDALALRFYDEDVNGSQEVYYALHDANFNVTAMIDDSGAVVERYHYTPYGEVTFLEDDFDVAATQVSAIGNVHLFTGRERDPETGLQLNRERYYHAQLGRWLTRDPIGYEGSLWNLYEYVEGTPTRHVDPYGENVIVIDIVTPDPRAIASNQNE